MSHSRKHLFSSVGAIFFAFMLLVAPCKVRNSIEAALGIEKTEVSNKIKSVAPPICCATQAKVVCTTEKQSQINDRLVAQKGFAQEEKPSAGISTNPQHNALPKSTDKSPGITIPYYILHSNFKVYS